MSNVTSRITPEQPESTGQGSAVLDIVIRQAGEKVISQDLLRRLPTEVRLMVFEELLIIWPKKVFRGAFEFGPLDEREVEEVSVPWQIILTCRQYFDEAVPIMYGKNRFVFCTGVGGKPGMFWRFPIHLQYMQYVTDLGIYLRADSPKAQGSKRVGHFVQALKRYAKKLENLTVMASSDWFFGNTCPWTILSGDHPVCKALEDLIKAQQVKHLKIRVHDGATFYPEYARFLGQEFMKRGPPTDHTLTFAFSCSCKMASPDYLSNICPFCFWPESPDSHKPIEFIVPPEGLEASMNQLMSMQDELFRRGILPDAYDDDDDDDDDDENGEDEYGKWLHAGYYRIPLYDPVDAKQPAFDSGLPDPGRPRRYRGALEAPKVWSFRQTELTAFFNTLRFEFSPIPSLNLLTGREQVLA